MQSGSLELIITLVSIIGANLGAVFGAFGFLHREMRRGFEKVDQRLERVDQRFAEIDQNLVKIDQNLVKIDQRFVKVDQRFAEIDQRFVKVDQRFAEIDQRFVKINEKFGLLEKTFNGKLVHLEEKVDKGLAAVRADVAVLQVSLARIEGHLGLAALPPASQLAVGEPPAQTA